MLAEIEEMPARAMDFLTNSPDYQLPLGVPYIGMGSSYFAPLCFKYMGVKIYPELAAEYFNYLQLEPIASTAVLLSQSGKSTEVLWCASLFESYTAITNNSSGTLCNSQSAKEIVLLHAGEEKFSSSKTYINTLLALFKGFGIDTKDAVGTMLRNFKKYDATGKELANAVFNEITTKIVNGLYITGSGPNIGTAMQAALILSESTKLNFNGLPIAQYDHGPKETANNSVVINIVSAGNSYDRTIKLAKTIGDAGALVLTVQEQDATENESVLHNIIPFNYMAYYLSEMLQVKDIFVVGGKVTEVV